jgi:hypothetical protein
MFSFIIGNTLKIELSRISTLILDCILSFKSIVEILFNSQERALNEYIFEVKAPTGHKSIIFPETSDEIILLEKLKISIELPLPVRPKYLKPAISSIKRIQRVQ